MKKLGVSFYLTAIAALLVIAGFVAMIVSHCVPDNALTYATLVIGVGVAAIILSIAYVIVGMKAGNQSVITYIIGLLVTVAIAAFIGLLIFERSWLASAIFTWDPYNTNGWTAFYITVASGVLYLLAEIVLIVSGFLGEKKITEK